MANIQTRTTTDNRVMHTARIRIKGYPQQTATFSRRNGSKVSTTQSSESY